ELHSDGCGDSRQKHDEWQRSKHRLAKTDEKPYQTPRPYAPDPPRAAPLLGCLSRILDYGAAPTQSAVRSGLARGHRSELTRRRIRLHVRPGGRPRRWSGLPTAQRPIARPVGGASQHPWSAAEQRHRLSDEGWTGLRCLSLLRRSPCLERPDPPLLAEHQPVET